MTCPVEGCGKTSTTFDPAMYLSIPLPGTAKSVEVRAKHPPTSHPHPHPHLPPPPDWRRVSVLFSTLILVAPHCFTFLFVVAADLLVLLPRTVCAIFRCCLLLLPLLVLQLTLATLDGYRPRRYVVWVSHTAKVKDLKRALSKACGTREDRLAFADVWQLKLTAVFDVSSI